MATQAELTITLRAWTVKPHTQIRGDATDPFEPHLDRVTGMIQEGYRNGVIVDERFNGWWETKFEETTPEKTK